MITFNLLPPQHQEKIKKMAICSILENLIATVFITLALVGLSFLVAKNTLENNLLHFSKTVTVTPESQKLNQEIKKLNLDLKNIQTVQKNFIKWSRLFIDLNQLIPANIQITNLEIAPDKEKNLLKINGQAKERKDLLTLEENLKNCPYFLKVNSPLKNILSKDNIDFNFEVEFKKENLNDS